MPERIYEGSHAEVEVALPDGSSVTVKRGEAAEFTAEVCKRLDEQGIWKKKGSGSGSKTAGKE